MFELKLKTSAAWTRCVLDNFDDFLLDHASCEKKASGMAMSLLSHYPDRSELVNEMIELALEEMNHFRQVVGLIHERGMQLGADSKDPYINELRQKVRTSPAAYLMDRLIVAAIVEKRGHERFGLIAEALPEGKLKRFYQAITRSEGKHFELFIHLAESYFPNEEIHERLEQLLNDEAEIVSRLPIKPQLH